MPGMVSAGAAALAPLDVVILAGGFGATLPTPSGTDGTDGGPGGPQLLTFTSRHLKHVATMRHRATDVGGVCPALVPVGGLPAVAHLLAALRGVRRLQPLEACAWVVCNEGDQAAFTDGERAGGGHAHNCRQHWRLVGLRFCAAAQWSGAPATDGQRTPMYTYPIPYLLIYAYLHLGT